jgi:hypothetical protein
LAKRGEITPPWGVPSSEIVSTNPFNTPSFAL